MIGVQRGNRLWHGLTQENQDLAAAVMLAIAQMFLCVGQLSFKNLQHVTTIIRGVAQRFGVVRPVHLVPVHAQRFAKDRTRCNIM